MDSQTKQDQMMITLSQLDDTFILFGHFESDFSVDLPSLDI